MSSDYLSAAVGPPPPLFEANHNDETIIVDLPDDWRADAPQDQQDWCPTCLWDGSWDSLLLGSGQRGSVLNRLGRDSLRASASANNLCCAVLLGILNHTDGGCNEHIQLSDIADSWAQLDDGDGWGTQTDMSHLFKLFASTSKRPPPGVPSYPPDDPPPTHTGSDRSFAWASDQIEHCSRHHLECQVPEGEPSCFIPSRLLQVPSDPRDGVFLRLRSDIPEGIRYAALSYCWGKRHAWPACRTTRRNLASQLHRISWSTLPPTLQDAVSATRQLGLEYLWIDSVCIIQDDEEDWQVESMQMATVYTHAHVTLSATRSVDPNTGMFSSRHADCLSHILTARFRGEEYPMYAFHVPHESARIEPRLRADVWRGSLERSLQYPMFNRAWTFQERLASRRVLLFGKEELIMECASGCVFEESAYRLHPLQLSDKTLKAAYAGAMDSPRKIWWEIVFTYSHLKLAVPTDRLPAIAAVAQRLALHNPTDEYLCGLWRNSFLSDLLWERVLNALGKGIGESPLILESWGAGSYVAPSWSWVSFRSKARNISNILEPLSEVLNVSLQYKDNSIFGRVSGGFLEIRGPMVDLEWHVRPHWKYYQFIDGDQEMFVPGNPDQKVAFSVDYDFYHGLGAPRPGDRFLVSCLLIGFDEKGSLGALVLYRIGRTNCYWRLGTVHDSPHLHNRNGMDWRDILDQHSHVETCIIQ